MPEYRLVFEKSGSARWLSHLDMMHTLARAFLRADIPLRHSEGFNPHPRISIAHPLSVGVDGLCELLDFETDFADVAAIPERINRYLPEDIRALEAYVPQQSARKIAFAAYRLELEYDNGAPSVDKLIEFFSRDPIPVEKRSKKGTTVINLHASYTTFKVAAKDDNTLVLEVIVDASQAPINPKYFKSALDESELRPDFMRAARTMFLDAECRKFV